MKPNDVRALNLMNAAAQHVLRVIPDIVMGYGYSDEYSFVFHKSCKLFERRSAKLSSTVVSTFTSAYTHLWCEAFSPPPVSGTYFQSKNNGATAPEVDKDSSAINIATHKSSQLDLSSLPTFDARCIVYPSNQNLRDYISWRQADCHVNNLYNTTFWALVLKGGMRNKDAENFLKGTVSSDKNEILWSRFNVNYNNEAAIFRKGSIVLRDYQLVNNLKAVSTLASEDETTIEMADSKDQSRTQREKVKKAKQKAQVIVQHIDVIKDELWALRPWLLTGEVGKPV